MIKNPCAFQTFLRAGGFFLEGLKGESVRFIGLVRFSWVRVLKSKFESVLKNPLLQKCMPVLLLLLLLKYDFWSISVLDLLILLAKDISNLFSDLGFTKLLFGRLNS